MGMSHTTEPVRPKRKLRQPKGRPGYNELLQRREQRAQRLREATRPGGSSEPAKSGPVKIVRAGTPIGQVDYKSYINSRQWSNRRKKFFRTNPQRCTVCGSPPPKLHVHHLSYEKMGSEPDCDLMALCELCHTQLHVYADRHTNMDLREATMAFVQNNKFS